MLLFSSPPSKKKQNRGWNKQGKQCERNRYRRTQNHLAIIDIDSDNCKKKNTLKSIFPSEISGLYFLFFFLGVILSVSYVCYLSNFFDLSSAISNPFIWFCHFLFLQYIYICIYHHPHVTLSARISLILSRHPSLSSIAYGMSSGLHLVSAQSCCI